MRAVVLVAALVVAASTLSAQLQEHVFAVGHVRSPGKYSMTPSMTVGDVIETAGGMTRNAPVWILRTVDNQRMEIAASLTDPVQGDDVVYIGPRR